VIPDSQIDSVIQAITESARTGDKGEEEDGIIFVSTVDQAIDIGSSHNNNNTKYNLVLKYTLLLIKNS
jgi:nitrogen regulatory protein PII